MFILLVLSFFMKLILDFQLIVFIFQVILPENLPNKKKNDAAQKKIKKITYSQHVTKLFSILRLLIFSVIYTFEGSLYNDDM